MMDKELSPFETLKQILRHVRNPDELNEHPWTRSLIVEQARASTSQLAQTSPGQQLVGALAGLFKELQPAAPPRCGKRLDPRWGEFGLLAALYFTPFNHGTPYPTSLVEGWRRIDQAILTSVYGPSAEGLTEEQIRRYRLVGSDLEYASPSTLSDWHRKGLQRFAEIILNRERCISRTSGRPSVILDPGAAGAQRGSEPRSSFAGLKRAVWVTITLLLVLGAGAGALKAWRIYQSGLLLYQNVAELREIMQGPRELEALTAALPRLKVLQDHLADFKEEARPVLWLSSRLGWVPVYGKDLTSAVPLIDVAEHLLRASLLSSDAAKPLLDELVSEHASLDIPSLTALLVEMEPELGNARRELDEALAARERIHAGSLSPRLQALVEDVDPLLSLGDEGLALAMALPDVLGAGSDGPKTYMLLVQNEDELRPTGGFITSIGNLVLHNGEIIRLEFESVDSDVQEDWSRPYPAAPWQLQEYMNSQVLILRDANWFSDFPTTARWAEYLYAYTHSHSVDGILAVDQQFLVMLLAQIGPLRVDDAPDPLTDQNVIEYMRQSKVPSAEEAASPEWYRKEFISRIANAILGELTTGSVQDWRSLSGVFLQALEERHLLLQFDDPALNALIAERGWDSAVRPVGGDYLLVTDTNIGFNKTNAVVDVRLAYDVDLTDLDSPAGTLTLTHQNNAKRNAPCVHWNTGEITGEDWYPINRCYWSYLRVYRQAGVDLLDATPHEIPGEWMMLGDDIPARVDPLEEEIPGVEGFGTLLVVPGGQAQDTSFRFALTPDVLTVEPARNEYTYHLRVQKQPGTLAHSLTIRIHLPGQARWTSIPAGGVLQDQHLLLETDLCTDVELDVSFAIP